MVGLLLITLNAFAQDKIKSLENKRVQLEKSIEYSKVLLEETRQHKTTSLHELALLNDQINNRRELIDIYV